MTPFGRKGLLPYGLKELVVYPSAPGTYTNPAGHSGKRLTYRINSQGGRGSDWSLTKAPGTLRILAIGGSSTFGVSNPEEAAWPVFLEQELRHRYHRPIEVFNGGRLGGALGTLPSPEGETLDLLNSLVGSGHSGTPDGWLAYHPDLVIYYEAYNNAPRYTGTYVDWVIAHLHTATWLGRLARHLYYRSMLYTYLVEKSQFIQHRDQQHGVFELLTHYQLKHKELIRLLRAHEITPVIVLQVLKYPEAPGLRQLDLKMANG